MNLAHIPVLKGDPVSRSLQHCLNSDGLGGMQISTGSQGKLLKQATWELSQLTYVGRALELISVKSSLWIWFMGSTSLYTIMCCSGSKGQLERQHLINICRPKFTVLVDVSSSWESQNSYR